MIVTWKTAEEHLDILRNRGLIISNEDIIILKTINYSHLIYEFSDPFYSDSENKIYKEGTTLWDIFFYLN